jgi:hypothetical protein
MHIFLGLAGFDVLKKQQLKEISKWNISLVNFAVQV